jgi:hypothetical protein
VPADEVQPRLQAYVDAERARGYRLDECPKMRLALFRTSDDHHFGVYNFNYLQADGWSNMVMLQELAALYGAFATGAAAPAFEPAASPRAYIDRVRAQDSAATETFWRAQLRGFTRASSITAALGTPSGTDPADRASFTKQHRRLDRTTSARLAAVGREERITLNTFIHAAWTLLLARYTGHSDILYGAVVSGRAAEIPGVEGLVGLFTNLVPVRPPAPTGFATVRDWLRAAQDNFLAIRRHEHSALADVETWSELPGHPPLFDSYIVLENIPHAETMQSQLDPTSPHSLVQLGIPLRVEVWPGPQVLLLIHYYRRYFRDEVIAEVLGDLEHAVQFLLDGLDQPPRLPRR